MEWKLNVKLLRFIKGWVDPARDVGKVVDMREIWTCSRNIVF